MKSENLNSDILIQRIKEKINGYQGIRNDRQQGLLKIVNNILNDPDLTAPQRIARLTTVMKGELKAINASKSSHFFSRPGNYTKMLESAIEELKKYAPLPAPRPTMKETPVTAIKAKRPLPTLPPKKSLPPLPSAEGNYSLLIEKYLEVEQKKKQESQLENKLRKMMDSTASETPYRPMEPPPRKEPGHDSPLPKEQLSAAKRYREKIHGLEKQLSSITENITMLQQAVDAHRNKAPQNQAPEPPTRRPK